MSRIVPGLILTVLLAVAALYLARDPIEPVMLSIVLGLLIANIAKLPATVTPGVKFSAKKLLPLGVILVGARLDFKKIAEVGAKGIVLSVLTIAAALMLFAVFIRLGWVKRKLGLLLGIGTGVCGGTAIVAVAPFLDAEESDVGFAVTAITLVGLVTMFALPLVGEISHMSEKAFGVWAGLSIHQTPQVIAAGYQFGKTAGDDATTVKLARVCLLAPAIFVVAWMARADTSTDLPRRLRLRGVFPLFVLGFLAMALMRTLGWLPPPVVYWCDVGSKILIVTAMAAVGLETTFAGLKQTGVRPLLLAALAAVMIASALFVVVRAWV